MRNSLPVSTNMGVASVTFQGADRHTPRHGADRQRRVPRKSDPEVMARRATVGSLAKAGLKPREIVAKTGFTPKHVESDLYILRRMDLDVPKFVAHTTKAEVGARREKVLAMAMDHTPRVAIAAALGVSKRIIWSDIRRLRLDGHAIPPARFYRTKVDMHHDHVAALMPAAAARGVTIYELVARLLGEVAADPSLVDAVLDDGVAA